MVVTYVANTLVNASTSFVFKNTYLYYGLTTVRTNLQQAVSEFTIPKFGKFAGGMIGIQLGTLAAIPVTMFLADLTLVAVRQSVKLIQDIYRTSILGEKRSQSPPLWRDVAVATASFAAGFFAKTYFVNYGMEAVGELLKYAFVVLAPLSGASMVVTFMTPALIAMITPSVTFAMGDIVGTCVGAITYKILSPGLFSTYGNRF
ncbi:MAG: hypothetical protein LLF94_05495 [Chlamydiales bacterium]|nr:hypothetical protein [Chlamydiales bacterium]